MTQIYGIDGIQANDNVEANGIQANDIDNIDADTDFAHAAV